MKLSQPYQPFLFRVLHGLVGFCVIAAILTAFWTYNTYDGRWGRLPLPNFAEIEGIHGTFGLYSILVFPLFVLYAFRQGQKRLLRANAIPDLAQVGTPKWWYTLHRLVNTLAIVALTFALFSGKMMDEKWLPNGELNHGWYYAHLIGWLIMVVCIGLHLLMAAKVGGAPLLLSMLNWRFRAQDSPQLWSGHIRSWWAQFRAAGSGKWRKLASSFKPLEAIVLVCIAAAWLLPLLK